MTTCKLHAQAYSNSLKRMEQLANAMLDRMPQVFYTKKDPTTERHVKPGTFWANPYSVSQLKEKEGDKDGGQHDSGKSDTGNKSSTSTTNTETAH